MGDWIEDYVRRLAVARVGTASSLVGCTVDGLEAEFGVQLPVLYRSMLRRFGKAAGRLIDRSEMDFYYDAIQEVNRRIRDADLGIKLPERAFVIRGRYDEQFEFVCNSPEVVDAPVYYVNDSEGEPTPYYASIGVWLDALFEDATGAGRTRPARP